jgi:hypothetical protein
MPLQAYNNSDAIFWGEFINVVYQMFENSGGSVAPPQPANFPKGWKLLADLSVGPGFLFPDAELIGVIAFNEKNPSQLAVVFRGTDSIWDWVKDGEFFRVPFSEVPNGGWTEYGFTSLYRTLKVWAPGGAAAEGVTDGQSLTDWAAGLDANVKPVIAGHSLGGALAILHAAVVGSRGLANQLYTMAAPQVGDWQFVQTFEHLPSDSSRIYNKPDWVPALPGALLGYHQVPTGIEINSLNYPQIKKSIYCYHALYTYLYVLGDPNIHLSPGCAASSEATQAAQEEQHTSPYLSLQS